MSRIVLKILNGMYAWIIGTVIMTTTAYAGYSIWDNAQVYQAAENVQNQIRQLKPDEEEEGGPGFEELRALNKDVVGWITVDGTNIDYPVLQGETNLTYMNKDVYGDFSLAGSIFLDTRNQADFSDQYSLIYGHNMDEHLMFGDLALFKDKDFFKKNTTATLMLPGESRDMKVAAILQVSAGTEEIFNPDMWKNGIDGFGTFLEENSIWYHSDLISLLKIKPNYMGVTALATCSDGSTNDRTVLILVRETEDPYLPAFPYMDEPSDDDTRTSTSEEEEILDDGGEYGEDDDSDGDDDGDGGRAGMDDIDGIENIDDIEGIDGIDDIEGTGPKQTGDHQDPDFWMHLILGILVFIFLFETADRLLHKREE